MTKGKAVLGVVLDLVVFGYLFGLPVAVAITVADVGITVWYASSRGIPLFV